MGVRLARDRAHAEKVTGNGWPAPSATPAPLAKTRQEKLTGRSRVYATSADNANVRPDQNIPNCAGLGGRPPWNPPMTSRPRDFVTWPWPFTGAASGGLAAIRGSASGRTE